MNPLPIGDRREVDAAEGWLMLGNIREAKVELARVTPQGQGHPDALRVRYEVAAAEKLWAEAQALAARLVELRPEEPAFCVWQGYATRRMPNGGLEKALAVLQPAAKRFPKEWIFPFNLACYLCQLGRPDEAMTHYRQALALGGRRVREMALRDPDLEPLRGRIDPA